VRAGVAGKSSRVSGFNFLLLKKTTQLLFRSYRTHTHGFQPSERHPRTTFVLVRGLIRDWAAIFPPKSSFSHCLFVEKCTVEVQQSKHIDFGVLSQTTVVGISLASVFASYIGLTFPLLSESKVWFCVTT
jgi:hypothetical protein